MSAYIHNREAPNQIVLQARNMAGRNLESLFAKHNEGVQDRFKKFAWVKAELTSPSFEHFTFSYKNAVFAVLIDVVSDGGHSLSERERELLCKEALKYNLVPCVYEVNVKYEKSSFWRIFDNKVAGKSKYSLIPSFNGWNLKHARTGDLVNPVDFGKDSDIPMSKWELLNFSIGIVKKYGIEKEGYIFDSFCDVPEFNPQVWFHDRNGRRSWVLVRFQPVLNEAEAEKYNDFVERNPHLAPYDGYFAPVSATMADPFLCDRNGNLIPLGERFDGRVPMYRGHGMYANFQRMIQIHKAKS